MHGTALNRSESCRDKRNLGIENRTVGGTQPSTGEQVKLNAENYDPERRCWVFEEHKTKKHIGAKTIWIPSDLADLTEKLIKKHPTGALFRNSIGRPWKRSSVFSRFQALKKKLNLKGKLMAYAMRHTFATNAVAKGTDSVVLAKLLGHTTTNTIMKTYVHPKDDHMTSSVEKIVAEDE